MQIDPRIALQRLGAAQARRLASGGSGFSAGESSDAARASTTSSTAATHSLDALLSLQADDTPQERKRRSVQHGHTLLDGLDRLKAALLSGRVPVGDLKRIASELARRPDSSGDPRLDELVAQIELRAQVELAKLQRRA